MDFKRYVFHGETRALKLAKKTSFLPLNMCIKSSDLSDYLHVSFLLKIIEATYILFKKYQ